MQKNITDDLAALLDVVPPDIREAIRRENHGDDLLEIVLDLGRQPQARFVEREVTLTEHEASQAELD